jgi:hypothetical protein
VGVCFVSIKEWMSCDSRIADGLVIVMLNADNERVMARLPVTDAQAQRM